MTAALACAAALLAGCTDDSPAAGPSAAPTASPDAADEQYARTLQIYAAVIRQVITKDDNYGGNKPTPYRRVAVVEAPLFYDAAAVDGGPFTTPRRYDEPFSTALRKDLRKALADLAPLRFVSVADADADARVGRLVRGPGAVVTVGRIVEAGSQAQVSYELRCALACGAFMTYVLERRADGWVVTGTTGVSTTT